jgi:hypothetical protein
MFEQLGRNVREWFSNAIRNLSGYLPNSDPWKSMRIGPDGSIEKTYDNQDFLTPLAGSQGVPTPTPTPPPKPKLDFPAYVSGAGVENLSQPPEDMTKMFFDVFPKEATQAAAVSAAEHLENPWATNLIGGPNSNGTYDYGLMQNNEATFTDLLRRRYEQMQEIKRNIQLNDLLDAIVSMKVSRLSRQDEDWSGVSPWSQWYGWQNKGWEMK